MGYSVYLSYVTIHSSAGPSLRNVFALGEGEQLCYCTAQGQGPSNMSSIPDCLFTPASHKKILLFNANNSQCWQAYCLSVISFSVNLPWLFVSAYATLDIFLAVLSCVLGLISDGVKHVNISTKLVKFLYVCCTAKMPS